MTEAKKNIVFCGVLTISDRCAAGTAEDFSGPNLQNVLQEFPGIKAVVKLRKIVPDEIEAIKSTLIDWSDKERVNLILTTGGTGLSPRDVTPEATAQVIEKELQAILMGLIAASLAKTRFAMLTRMKCGIRGKTLIINFPGSKKVSEECLRFLLPILNHGIDVLSNNLSQVDTLHRAADMRREIQSMSVADDRAGPTQATLPSASLSQPIVQLDRRVISPNAPVIPQDAHVIPPDAHVIPPDAHVIPADAHVIPPDAHVIPPDAHIIPSDAHIIPPDVHVIPPDIHVIPSYAHVISPDAHVIPPGAHVIPPDAHVVTSDAHVIPPDAHVIPPDAHVISLDAHVIPSDPHVIRSDAHVLPPLDGHVIGQDTHVRSVPATLELDSNELENELQSRGLLRQNSPPDSSPALAKPSQLVASPYTQQKLALRVTTAGKRRSNTDFYLPLKVAKRDRASPYPLVPMDKSIATVLANTPVLSTEILPYEAAFGYIIATDVISPEAIPQFAASIKDGYAVIAADTPGELKVVGASIYGLPGPKSALKTGQTIRITTGSQVPPGADAIVQVEDTKLVEEARNGEIELKISVVKKATTGQDIRPIGTDIRRGELVLPAGTLIGPSEIGILATIGVTQVKVYKKPVVAVLSTGNEISEPDSAPLEIGQVRDSNRKTLLFALKQAGFETIDFGIVLDDPGKIKLSLETAIEKADVVITSGGVSVGERDFLKSAIKAVGGTIHFGRVLMKPGKPTTFASANTPSGTKLFFALPGNPVSSIVTFNLFTLPALKKMSGFPDPNSTVIKARVESDIRLDTRPEYQRCTIKWKKGDSTAWATTTGNQISSRLVSMINANALLVLPPKSEECSEIVRGDLVDALLIDQL